MHARSGQVLVEIVIASVILMVVSLAITQVITASLRAVDQTMNRGAATFLGSEQAEAVRAVAREDWHNISNLATGTSNTYDASQSGGKWVLTSGSATTSLNNIVYTYSLYFSDVYRASSSDTATGDISSGGYYDPSTVKETFNITWNDPTGADESFSQVLYLARYLNTLYTQTDWSGGTIGDATVTAATTTFATSTSVDTSSTSGSFQLQAQ
jgi:Tfp pilus assembly protein PilV